MRDPYLPYLKRHDDTEGRHPVVHLLLFLLVAAVIGGLAVGIARIIFNETVRDATTQREITEAASQAQGLALLISLVLFSLLCTKVGYRWFDCFLALIPLFGLFLTVKVCWRFASLPHAYWSSSIPPPVPEASIAAGETRASQVFTPGLGQDTEPSANPPPPPPFSQAKEVSDGEVVRSGPIEHVGFHPPRSKVLLVAGSILLVGVGLGVGIVVGRQSNDTPEAASSPSPTPTPKFSYSQCAGVADQLGNMRETYENEAARAVKVLNRDASANTTSLALNRFNGKLAVLLVKLQTLSAPTALSAPAEQLRQTFAKAQSGVRLIDLAVINPSDTRYEQGRQLWIEANELSRDFGRQQPKGLCPTEGSD